MIPGGAFFQPQPLFQSLKTSLIYKRLNAPKDSKIFYSWSTQTKQQQELLIG
jgi:hypothetical protein